MTHNFIGFVSAWSFIEWSVPRHYNTVAFKETTEQVFLCRDR